MSANEKGQKEEKKDEQTSVVAPTDIVANDIEMFGQENIPFYVDSNKGSNKFNYNITNKSSEDINIGITPSGILTEKPKKKKIVITKKMFIILIAILILAIGLTLYFFLSKTKTIATFAVKTKDIEVSIGSKLPLNLDEYATFNNVNPTNCYLVTTEVKTDTLGKYNYSIMCGVNEYKGKITIIDKSAPEVITKMVIKKPGDALSVDEFIYSCEDHSNCNKTLNNIDDLIGNMNMPGNYLANITVSDDIGNSKEVSEYLVVTTDNYKFSMQCVFNNSFTSAIDGYYDEYSDFAFNNEELAIVLLVTREYHFNEEEEYKKFKEQIKEEKLLIDDFEGQASTNDNNMTIKIKQFQDVNTQSLFVDELTYSKLNSFYTGAGNMCQKNM